MPASRKFIVTVEVDPSVERALEMITEKRGMTQVSLVSRAVKWFARQDAETQTEILNSEPSLSQTQKPLKRLASHG